MVHALRRARQHLREGGMAVLIQPHQHRRPHIAIVSARKRQPVSTLVNAVFQPLINSANAAIETVVDEKLFDRVARINHQFKVSVANPSVLREYVRQSPRPPRFPAGARQRLRDLWRGRRAGAEIEVTEFFTVIALRALR